mgnify:CR=1 FL=1
MPKNFKQELLFTGIMAGLMVLVMAGYNVALAQGIGHGYVLEVLRGYPLALLVAAVLDLALVGPVMKHLFFTHLYRPVMDRKPFLIGVGISILMVLGMVTLMSGFGLIMSGRLTGNVVFAYLHTWAFNIMMALPLQLIIVGPIARAVLSRVQRNGSSEDEESQTVA